MKEGLTAAVQEGAVRITTKLKDAAGGKPDTTTKEELAGAIGDSGREASQESEVDGETCAKGRALELRDLERIKRLRHSSIVSLVPDWKPQPDIAQDEHREADSRVWAALHSDELFEGLTFDCYFVG